MKAVLIQQVYPNRGFLPLVQEQFIRNTDYCEKFGLDYRFFSSERHDCLLGGWDKLDHIHDCLDYELIIWLDADAIVCDINQDIKTVPLPEDSIGAVRFNIPISHYNVGVLYVRPGIRSKAFLEKWISEFPGSGIWHEQSVFNSILNECVVPLPITWNRNYDNNPYAKPMVMGFHGFGTPEHRLALMKKVLQ
jgi:Lipopolysaccharide biosynthesis proteins, LPS:glycosyltransferases